MNKPLFTPIVRLAIPFISGMVMANCFIHKLQGLVPHLLATSIVLVISLIILYYHQNTNSKLSNKYRNPLFGCLSMALVFTFGMTLFIHSHKENRLKCNIDDKHISGIILSLPQEKKKTTSLIIENSCGDKLILYIQNNSGLRNTKIKIGDCISAFSMFGITPTWDSDTTKFKDYKAYLFSQGISGTAYVDSASWAIHNTSRSENFIDRLREIGRTMGDTYVKAGLTGDEGSIIYAMTTGNKSGLSKELKSSYSKSGLSHVLALSGFHLSVIFTILSTLLFVRFIPIRFRWILGIAVLIGIWLFGFMAGMPASLLRSVIMFSIMWVCSIGGRNYLSLNSAALAAIIMLIYNPITLLDIGFQLSFISIIGISVFGVPLCGLVKSRNVIIKWIWSAFAISSTCCVFCTPIVAVNFGRIPLAGIPASMIVSVIAAILLYFSALWWLLSFVSSLQDIISICLRTIARFMNDIANLFASTEWMSFYWSPGVIEITLYYTGIMFLTAFIRQSKGMFLTKAIACFTIMLTICMAKELLSH